MNNVESALIIGFVFLLGTFALYNVVNDTTVNTNLDAQSQQIVLKYNDAYSNITNEEIFSNQSNISQINYEGVDPFYRTTAESKGSSNKFNSGWKVFVKFPVMLMSSIPFIEQDENINYIIGLFVGLIGLFGFIAIYKFWFGGNTNN